MTIPDVHRRKTNSQIVEKDQEGQCVSIQDNFYLHGGISESSSCQIVNIWPLIDFFLIDFLVKLSDTSTVDNMGGQTVLMSICCHV